MVEATVGKVALITGGGTGVGAATARLFAARGWSVGVVFRRSREAADAVLADCRAEGTEAFAVAADVALDSDCRNAVSQAMERFGRIDALVCSAGTTQFTGISDFAAQNAENFQRVYATNVVGAWQMARAAAPALRDSGSGAVVNVSSIASRNGSGTSLAYIASKGALNSLTLALARLLAPQVRVNAVLPGMIDTGWFSDAFEPEAFDELKRGFAENTALGTVCSAEDIAAGVVFLAADATRMTGELMTVDAGYSLGRAVSIRR